MLTTSCAVAIVISLVQIFCNNGNRENLERDHPEVSLRDYGPSNVYMIILLICEVIILIISFFR